jgi:hypothetical protein
VSGWFSVTLSCAFSTHIGPDLARDLQTEFWQNYPHEHGVSCTYKGGKRVLANTNIHDRNGLNLMDESRM